MQHLDPAESPSGTTDAVPLSRATRQPLFFPFSWNLWAAERLSRGAGQPWGFLSLCSAAGLAQKLCILISRGRLRSEEINH